MSTTWPKAEASPSQTHNWIIALCACVLILPVAWVFDTPVSSFLLAIVVSSFLGNRLSGYLATVITALLFLYFQDHPSIAPHGSPYWRLAFLIILGCLLPELAERSKRVERSRARSESDFRTLVQTSPDPIILLDGSARIVGINPATLTMFGCNDDAILGHPVTGLIPEFSADDRPPRDFEAIRLPGDRIQVSATWAHLGDKTSVFLRDVTLRRRMETELKASEENLRLLVETIPGLVYVRDAQGALEQVNHRVTEFNGFSLEQLRRENGLSAVHPEDRPRIAALLQQGFPQGKPFSYEFRHRRADGVYRFFHASIEPLKNAQGAVIRWYTLLTDIEDRKSMENSLRAMQTKVAETSRLSTVTEITASVVHEISQPLSAIISHSQACLRYLSTDNQNLPVIKTTVERILRNGRDASETVKNIRALFRRRALDTHPVDLRKVIQDVLLLHETKIREQAIRVSVSVDPALPSIPGDPLQIQQVLVNLVANAVEAMESSPHDTRELDIRASSDGTKILAEVADRGHGLTEPDKIFELFFTTKQTGMGVGLRISKTIIEAHQGQLWAEPRPDRGTRFLFSLPVTREDA